MSARISLALAVAAFALLAGCAADSDDDDIEALIDERVKAALAEQAASTTTEAAVDVEVLRNELWVDFAERPTWLDLSDLFACHVALDELALNVERMATLNDAEDIALFALSEGQWSDIVGSMGDLFTDDGSMLGEPEAERLCADIRPILMGAHASLTDRHDRLEDRLEGLLDAPFGWRYSCTQSASGSTSRANSGVANLCEKVRTRYRN